ncbi:hypothetical protein OG985_50265 (plasmid) [Streptomyces sp. NBC_00289]|uniref:hypothetical protein n=1 Tax=Streptomyces sp. NBC_00289 TaxID=2975703 RepID=UPI002F915567
MSTQTPNPSFRSGADAIRGGLDITISLTPGEAEALGFEAGTLADWFDTALWALALLRNGYSDRGGQGATDVTPEALYTVLNDLDHRLLPRLQGIRDAAVRRHQELGGSIGDLALAMDVAKSTAQSRRNVVMNRAATSWERWATQGGPEREHCGACGHPARPTDPIVTTADDDAFRIHRSHATTPGNGFFGTPTDEGVSPYSTGTRVAGGFVIGQRVRITGVSGPLADRTDLIGRVGEVTAEARDGSLNVRGLSGKPRAQEVFADILGFQVTELEAADGSTEPTRD